MKQENRQLQGEMRLMAAVFCAGMILVAGCSTFNDPDDLAGDTAVTLPSAGQMSLDLPNALAPSSGPQAARGLQAPGQAVCAGENYPGAAVACMTRILFAGIVTNFDGMMSRQLADVAGVLETKNILQGVVLNFTHDGFDVKARWDDRGETTDYDVTFLDPESGATVGHWTWSITPDGNAGGVFKMLPVVLARATDEAITYGLLYSFESNRDGTEKTIEMDVDFGDAPGGIPIEDPSSPAALKLSAVKSAGTWSLSYGLYFPAWLSESIPGGLPTVELVKAAGGVEETSPAVMSIVVFGADVTSVPAGAEDNHAVCDYVVPLMEGTGAVPPGAVVCGDNNPFYLGGDGSILEGGPAPAGFEGLAAALTGVGFVVNDPTVLRDLSVGF